ncbi:MAG: amidohydrolase family protein [Ideonella sp.]|nr:amidohydrolase family protein [Ideonella sp.]
MHDLVIRGGSIVDGSGAPRFSGDIAIDGGRITQVGGTAGTAQRVIDASGALVTPGWVDVHTHYDGQVTWDPYITPSSWHGVTTAVMGNCGVGFAPVKPDRHDWLIGLMEGVEDIPGSALSEGIHWEWETFAQYLDALGRKPLAVDVGTQVPHGALRVYAMGERGVDEHSVATPEDIAAMAAELRSGLRAGALGFSTSRTLIHRGADGKLVPGTFANRDELFGIGRVLGEEGHGVFQMTSNHIDMPAETEWMMALARETQRPVLFNLQQIDQAPDLWKSLVARLDEARAQGVPLIGSIPGRPAGVLYGWRASSHPFHFHATWRETAQLPIEQRIARLRDPQVKARLLAEHVPIADERAAFMLRSFNKMYRVDAAAPNYEPAPHESAAAMAAARGVSPFELVYEWMMADAGEGLVYFPIFNYSYHDFSHLHRLLQHPSTMISLGDGGAHVGYITDAGLPTFMLTHWTRDRSRGPTLPLEDIVRRQTSHTASVYGLHDRGLLKPGLKADLNLIDYAHLSCDAPYMAYDLPAGGKRLLQKARGYIATLVAGQPIYEHGEPTGALPGALVRGRAA